jgi:hypothetical protein
MREIPISGAGAGVVVTVDEEDYEELALYKWWLNSSGYPRTEDGVLMHVYLVGIGYDHKDRNPLNNCRSNLRKATASQQQWNQNKTTSSTSSQYKGVTWYARTRRWKAQIACRGMRYHLGYFVEEEDAAKAYDTKAVELFGEYAKTNF